MAIGVSGSKVLAREGDGEVIEEAQTDEVEARYGIEVEELVEEGRWQMGAEMCGVVDCVAGDLLRTSVRDIQL